MPVASKRKPVEKCSLAEEQLNNNAALLHYAAIKAASEIDRGRDQSFEDTPKILFEKLSDGAKRRYKRVVEILTEQGLWKV